MARVVLIDDDPTVAELGIVVVDRWQGYGIGRRLLECIVTVPPPDRFDVLDTVISLLRLCLTRLGDCPYPIRTALASTTCRAWRPAS